MQSPWAFQHMLRALEGFRSPLNNHRPFRNSNWSTGNRTRFFLLAAMFMIIIHHRINSSFWVFQRAISSHSSCYSQYLTPLLGISQVNKIFKNKRRETKSADDIKVSANIHCSNLFTWDDGKALGEVWPGSNSAQLWANVLFGIGSVNIQKGN